MRRDDLPARDEATDQAIADVLDQRIKDSRNTAEDGPVYDDDGPGS